MELSCASQPQIATTIFFRRLTKAKGEASKGFILICANLFRGLRGMIWPKKRAIQRPKSPHRRKAFLGKHLVKTESVSLLLLKAVENDASNDVIARLLDEGADPSARYSGDTVLHFAASKRSKRVYDFLVSRGADETLENAEGLTPPQLADRFFNPK